MKNTGEGKAGALNRSDGTPAQGSIAGNRCGCYGLDCLLNLAVSQTTRANANALYRAVFHNFNALEIRIKFARANIMRVRNCMTEHWTFCTNMTLHRHILNSR
jgi:hypothetical protein